MSTHLEVAIPAQSEAQPTLEELAAQMDEANPQPEPSTEDRPTWLPEKFKSPEDMAKAYAELERKQSTGITPPPATEGEGEEGGDNQDEDANEGETAEDVVANAGLDFEALSTEYQENGELSEQAYEKLTKAGIPKDVVDAYIAGQDALLNAAQGQVFTAVGGKDAYDAMLSWAADTMSEQEITAYNKAVDSGDMNTAIMAAKGLQARHTASVGVEPKVTLGGNSPASAEVYESVAQVTADMNDPRYRTDNAFRQKVEQKLGRSNVF